MNRRAFLAAAGAGVTALAAQADPLESVPIIDTHIHLFDQTRPQGVPYSGGKTNTGPSLPPRFRKLASPLGIVGAVAIEASPWIEDNLWLLEAAQSDPIMVGVIGNLRPEKPESKEYLDRYHRNKLFLGIRYGNLWGYDLVAQVANPAFLEGIGLVAQADLTLDSANPRPDLLEAAVRLTDRVPELRIVMDHVPSLLEKSDASTRGRVGASLKELAQRPKVYIKVSQVMQIVDGRPSTAPALYKPFLDFFFETFGEDRLVFGSDWPNGAAVDNYPTIVRIVQNYFAGKGRAAAEKYFWKNSAAAYKWIRRDPAQPQL